MLVIPLLALFLSANPTSPGGKQSFEQIAKQADEARSADLVGDAIRLYSEGVHQRPAWSEGWWSLGSLFYDQDRFPEAEGAFRRFVVLAPKPAAAYAFLGLCEYEIHDYARATDHFQKWARAGFSGTTDLIDVATFHWALLLTREGRFVEALYLLTTEAEKRGATPALIEAIGLASLRMAKLPEDYPPEQREMVWLAGKATFYSGLESHDFARADDYAHRLLLHYGNEPNVHYFRGILFGFERKKGEASEEFQQELRLSPQHAPAMLELARLAQDDGRLDEATSLAWRAAELDPKNAEAHYQLGLALLAGKQLQNGVHELELAEQLAPDSAPIRLHLARAYQQLGSKQKAKDELAVFMLLRKKEEVLAPPKEKLGSLPKPASPTR
jgi:tetratricopeptide (TPR) repeat protein